MNEGRDQPLASPGSAEEGRTATAAQLRQRLAEATPAFLEGAAENPALGVEELLRLLRNRQAPSRLLMCIGRDRRWTRNREVKRALARHPRAPLVLARSLLPHLYWRDLAEISADPRVNPVVRRQAEGLIRVRIEELSLGEQVALARRASRGLIGCLIETRQGPVLRALLYNPRMVEMEAVRLASSPSAAPGLFRAVAEHPTWGNRPAVRLALVRNPRTPAPVALGILRRMPTGDLRRLVKDVKVPTLVRVGADRRLSGKTGRTPTSMERWRRLP